MMTKTPPAVDASKAMTVHTEIDLATGDEVTYSRPALDPTAKPTESRCKATPQQLVSAACHATLDAFLSLEKRTPEDVAAVVEALVRLQLGCFD